MKIALVSTRVSRLLSVGLTTLSCLAFTSLSSADTLLTENFNIGTSTQGSPVHSGYWWLGSTTETPLPNQSQVKYWKADAASSDGLNRGMGFNGSDGVYANAFINQRGNTDLTKQKWWLRDLRDGPEGSDFYSANGTTAVHLSDSESFNNPSFTGTLYYTYGANLTTTTDLAVTYSLVLLNNEGNGYAATLSVMDGIISFYQLDDGLGGDWGEALATSATGSRLNNFVTSTFSVLDGQLSFGTTIGGNAGPSLTFDDSSYSEFTTIGFAALLENSSSPYVRIRNVSLQGNVIPEPASLALILGGVIGLAVCGRRRSHS